MQGMLPQIVDEASAQPDDPPQRHSASFRRQPLAQSSKSADRSTSAASPVCSAKSKKASARQTVALRIVDSPRPVPPRRLPEFP